MELVMFEEELKFLNKGRYFTLNYSEFHPLNWKTISQIPIMWVRELIKYGKKKRESFPVIKLIHINTSTISNTHTGNRMILRKLDNQLLVFDDEKKLLYRRFASLEQANKLKEGQETLMKFYRFNQVRFLDKQLTMEKIIQGENLRNNINKQTKAFNQMTEDYKSLIIKGDFITFCPRINAIELFDKLESTLYPSEMIDYIKGEEIRFKEIYMKLRWSWAHLDLTPDNIIINDKDDIYVIDGEWCDIMPLLYDLIILLVMLVLKSNNFKPINQFLTGTYDSLILKVLEEKFIMTKDREILILIMLVLKGLITWDSKLREKSKKIALRRWEVVNKAFSSI